MEEAKSKRGGKRVGAGRKAISPALKRRARNVSANDVEWPNLHICIEYLKANPDVAEAMANKIKTDQ